jgi:hypothetical protein
VTGSDADTEGGADADTATGTDADTDGRPDPDPDPDTETDGATDADTDGAAETELGAGAGMEAEGGSEDGTGAGGAAAEGETDAVADGTPDAIADAVGFGVESAPAPTGVPSPPVPVVLLAVFPVPVSGTAPEPLPGRSGEVGRGNGSDPVRAVVSTRPSEPAGSSARCREDQGMRTAIADAAGAGPEAGDPSGPRGSRRTRMETADSTRKAIAPADISMTGPVVPAGCLRKTEPACPMVALIRSANSAKPSCTPGSRGP